MAFVELHGAVLHYRYQTGQGRPVVFLNSLGTDFRIWDAVIAGLDAPVLCMDKRGHGLSDHSPVSMDALVQDAAALMDHLGIGPAVICGVSVGGMIAQGLAVARPDLVAGLVLCCTGARIGDDDSWNARIAAVQRDGLAAMADAVTDRWFSPQFHSQRAAELAGYRNMLTRTLPAGYTAVSAAIRDADFTAQLSQITAPTLCIAGANDKATPPELVQHLARLISGAEFRVLENCGHLPCVEAPMAVAQAVQQLRSIGL